MEHGGECWNKHVHDKHDSLYKKFAPLNLTLKGDILCSVIGSYPENNTFSLYPD